MNKTENRLVPELRFPEFKNDSEWEILNLGKVLTKNTLKNRDLKCSLVQSVSNRYGFVNQDEYFENRNIASKNTSNYYVIKKGDFAYNPSRIDVGSLAYKQDEDTSIISPLYVSFKIKNKKVEDLFLFYWFNSEYFKNQMIFEGGVRNTLSFENLSAINFTFCSTNEQQKIASCLSSLYDVIAAHMDKLENLKHYKKGLLQNVFPQEGETVPKFRFKEFEKDGEWVEIELNILATKVTDKNSNGKINRVFTNSALEGIIDQRDFFDKDIADKSNLESYYIVKQGDYVYNPRISNYAPVGPISKNKTGSDGAMSPLYTVFRFTNIDNDFYEFYFKTQHWHNSIRKIANAGARFDRMSITSNEFMSIKVLSTNPKEQQKIASLLSSVDDLINAETDKIAQLKAHKKGLLQGLFPKIEK